MYKRSYPHVHVLIATHAQKQHKYPDTPTLVHLHTYMCLGNHTCTVTPYTLKDTYTYRDTHELRMSPYPTPCAELHTLIDIPRHLWLCARARTHTHIPKLMHTSMLVYISTHVPRYSSIHAHTPQKCVPSYPASVHPHSRLHTRQLECAHSYMCTLACLEQVNTDCRAKLSHPHPAGDRHTEGTLTAA